MTSLAPLRAPPVWGQLVICNLLTAVHSIGVYNLYCAHKPGDCGPGKTALWGHTPTVPPPYEWCTMLSDHFFAALLSAGSVVVVPVPGSRSLTVKQFEGGLYGSWQWFWCPVVEVGGGGAAAAAAAALKTLRGSKRAAVLWAI